MPASPISIDRRSNLSPEEFRREYAEKRRPVVFTDASRTWRAHQTVTPQWLSQQFGDKRIALADRSLPLAEVLQILEQAKPGDPVPYPCTVQIEQDWPELLPLLDPLPFPMALPNRAASSLFKADWFGSKTEVFLGGSGGNFPYAHVDYYHLHAWINMIFGVKEFWVFSTDDDAYMYPEARDTWRSGVPNIFEPDYEKYPLLEHVTPSKIEVGPGETLYIPAGTWHSARSLSLTMSVAFDQLDGINMGRFMNDVVTSPEHSWSKRMKFYAYFSVLRGGAGAVEHFNHWVRSSPAMRGLM
jgi:hypothetical protein